MNMQETNATYIDMFIIYSNKDEKFTRKLNADLECYCPPRGHLHDTKRLNNILDI